MKFKNKYTTNTLTTYIHLSIYHNKNYTPIIFPAKIVIRQRQIENKAKNKNKEIIRIKVANLEEKLIRKKKKTN